MMVFQANYFYCQNAGIFCALDVVKETEILVDIEVMKAKDQLSAQLCKVCRVGMAELNSLLSQALDQALDQKQNKLERYSSPKALLLLTILKETPFKDSG